MSFVTLHTHVLSYKCTSVCITAECGFHAQIHSNCFPKLSDVESTLETNIKDRSLQCFILPFSLKHFFLSLISLGTSIQLLYPPFCLPHTYAHTHRHIHIDKHIEIHIYIHTHKTHRHHAHTGDLCGPSQLVQSPICSNSCCYCCCLAPWLI